VLFLGVFLALLVWFSFLGAQQKQPKKHDYGCKVCCFVSGRTPTVEEMCVRAPQTSIISEE
jgi:hypothetical protein